MEEEGSFHPATRYLQGRYNRGGKGTLFFPKKIGVINIQGISIYLRHVICGVCQYEECRCLNLHNLANNHWDPDHIIISPISEIDEVAHERHCPR